MKDSDESEVVNEEMDLNEVAEKMENPKIVASTNNVSRRKLVTGESEIKRRKRGRRGGKRRGGKNAADLTELPDGILLVEDGDYVGYHCTYCNCVLGSITTVNNHVSGFRHQLITETKTETEGQFGEEEQNEGTSIQSESEKLENVGVQENISESNQQNESSAEASLSLKSYLEDILAKVSDPIIGLDYVTEKREANKEPSFECDLCKVTANADDMKVHILGTRHRLMYLKTKDPQKIAELMTKNLQKTERNKEIEEYCEVLMNQQGRGSIVVKLSGSFSEEALDQTEPPIKNKRTSGAQRRRRKRKAGDQQNTTEQRSLQQVSRKKKKNNQGTFDKKRKGIAKAKRKNPYDEAYSSRKKQKRGRFQRSSKMQIPRKEFDDRNQYPIANQYYQNYDYCGEPYLPGRDEERFSYGNDSPSNQNRQYQNDQDPVKLHDVDVTNEEEAGVVMNVINSLTERFLKYKLKNIAGPAKEILEKSLKGEDLLHALGALTGEKDKIVAENVTNTRSLPKQDKADHCRPDLNETSVGNPVEKAHRNWNNERDNIPTKGVVVDLPHRDWDKSRDPREKMNQRQRPNEWDDNRDAYPKNNTNRPQSKMNQTRDERPRYVVDQSQHDWYKARDVIDQPQRTWNETRDITSNRNKMDQSRDWSETRDCTYRKDVVNHSKSDWNEGNDTTYARNMVRQPQHDWDDVRDSQPRDVMDHPRHAWNENRNVSTLKNEKSIEQPQHSWGETRRSSEANQNASSFSQFPHRQTPFTGKANFDLFSQSHYGSDKADKAVSLKNTNFETKFPQRQTPFTGKANFDSFSQSHYGSDMADKAVALKNTNFDSFSQNRQSQGQPTWLKTDSLPMKSQNSRYFGQSSVDWNEKSSYSQPRSTTGSFTTQSSHLQGSTSSLPVKNVDYPSYVDDMFDNYQKKIRIAENSRSTVTNMDSRNSSYPTLTTHTQYTGPPAPLSYNRPSTFGRLPSASFPSWN